jgi:hypothetical protein
VPRPSSLQAARTARDGYEPRAPLRNAKGTPTPPLAPGAEVCARASRRAPLHQQREDAARLLGERGVPSDLAHSLPCGTTSDLTGAHQASARIHLCVRVEGHVRPLIHLNDDHETPPFAFQKANRQLARLYIRERQVRLRALWARAPAPTNEQAPRVSGRQCSPLRLLAKREQLEGPCLDAV